MNRVWAAAGIIMLVFTVCSCATVPDTVATVNGVKISGSEYERALNGFLANYGLTEESLYESLGAEDAAEYKNNIIDELVLQELMLQYASEHGLDKLSSADESSISERAEDYFENLSKSFEEEVSSEGTLQGQEAQTEAAKRYDDYIETYGYTKEALEDQFRRQIILDRVYEDVMKDGSVSDSEVQAYYDDAVKSAQAAEGETDAADAVNQFVSGQDSITVYIPQAVADGVRNVKHVLIRIPEDVSSQIAQLNEEDKQSEAQELREQTLALLKPKADEVVKQAQEGADFDMLIAQYNDDPGMEYYPDGYQVYEGASFDAAFLAEALSLEKPGDVSSEPVESAYGYHIIQYSSSPQAGPVPFDSVREEIADMLQQTKRRELWESAVSEWKQSAEIDQHRFRAKE